MLLEVPNDLPPDGHRCVANVDAGFEVAVQKWADRLLDLLRPVCHQPNGRQPPVESVVQLGEPLKQFRCRNLPRAIAGVQ
ncbi:hypothetical protein [Caulifigura coniformis]|uniref:hypothetical protein n=1 Tax=Caulifigura coniformis TaxID=2527983 RepID=UPI001E2E2A08|nr:hypothetical protein [Caulifigura coniformis]